MGNAFRKFRSKGNSGGTFEKPPVLQSQRDCVFQPRVARNELPWVPDQIVFNPNGVASGFKRRVATPLGLFVLRHVPQGSSFLATLGFEPESLWDSSLRFPKGQLHSPGERLDNSPPFQGWDRAAGLFSLWEMAEKCPDFSDRRGCRSEHATARMVPGTICIVPQKFFQIPCMVCPNLLL